MTAMRDRPFPFRASAATMPAMRHASLALREQRGIVRVRVNWPTLDEKPPVIVFVSGDDVRTDIVDAFCRGLCAEAGILVVSLRTACFDTATTTLEWTADHAEQLDADPAAVLIGGIGRGAALAATVALGARRNGWPDLTRQVLIRPDFDAYPDPLAGVAPATVVGISGYSDRLREAGVEVEQVGAICDLAPVLRRAMNSDRISGLST
jgi:acetyl esterase/lipase